jgi:hypothetical protein
LAGYLTIFVKIFCPTIQAFKLTIWFLNVFHLYKMLHDFCMYQFIKRRKQCRIWLFWLLS